MKHIEDNHDQPLHACGRSKELVQNSTDFNNNEKRVAEVEPMETESDGFGAGTEFLEIQEAIDPINDQGSFNKTEKELQAKRGPIRQVQRQQTLLYKHRRFNNGFQICNCSNRWKPRWNQDTGRGRRDRYQKPKISKEELDAQLDLYMANRPKQVFRDPVHRSKVVNQLMDDQYTRLKKFVLTTRKRKRKRKRKGNRMWKWKRKRRRKRKKKRKNTIEILLIPFQCP